LQIPGKFVSSEEAFMVTKRSQGKKPVKKAGKAGIAKAPSEAHRKKVAGAIRTGSGHAEDWCSACDCGCYCSTCDCGCSAREWEERITEMEQQLGRMESLMKTRFGDISKILERISTQVEK
jgi:hypothetical protein